MYKFKVGDRVMHERFGVGTVIKHDPKMGLFPYLVKYDHENIALGKVVKGDRTHKVYGVPEDSHKRYAWCGETSLKEVKAESSDRKPENQKPAPKFKVGDEVEVQIKPGNWRKGVVIYSGFEFSGEWLYKVNIDNKKWSCRTCYESRIRPLPRRPRVRRCVIEITDDGAEAKYIVGRKIEKSASVKRHWSDAPDDGRAVGYAVEKLFSLSDTKLALIDELLRESEKQESATKNVNRIFRELFEIED